MFFRENHQFVVCKAYIGKTTSRKKALNYLNFSVNLLCVNCFSEYYFYGRVISIRTGWFGAFVCGKIDCRWFSWWKIYLICFSPFWIFPLIFNDFHFFGFFNVRILIKVSFTFPLFPPTTQQNALKFCCFRKNSNFLKIEKKIQSKRVDFRRQSLSNKQKHIFQRKQTRQSYKLSYLDFSLKKIDSSTLKKRKEQKKKVSDRK